MSNVSIQHQTRNQNYPPNASNNINAFDSIISHPNGSNQHRKYGDNDYDSRGPTHHRPMDYDGRGHRENGNSDNYRSDRRHDGHRSSQTLHHSRPLAASNTNESSSFNPQPAEPQRQRRSRFTDNTDVAPQPMANYSEPFQASNSRPVSQPSRWNNNKTPSYDPASKTPNYAPNKTPSHVTNDEDWDDAEPARPPIQATLTARSNNSTPSRYANNKTPSYVPNDNDYRGPPAAALQQQRFNNNKTPSYAPAADDENWDDGRVNALQTEPVQDFNKRGFYNREGADTQRKFNNNYNRPDNNNYARNKSPGAGYNNRGGGGDYNRNNRSARNQHYNEENWDDDVPSHNTVVQPPVQQSIIPQPTTPAARYANDDDWDE